MSKTVTRQEMTATCDVCRKASIWDTLNPSTETVAEMQTWLQVGRKAVVNGKMVQIVMDVCSIPCGEVALVKIMNPPPIEGDDDLDHIDLAALQASQAN